jgi:Rrf2 family protein
MFAIEAVLDIAYNSGAQPVQSREINGRQGIPRRYLEPVLQQLVRAGILEGVRGPRGGYRLARERRKITLAEIAEAVRTTEATADPFEIPTGSPLGLSVVRPLCLDLVKTWSKELETISIEDLCMRAREKGIESVAEKTADFSI